MLVEERTLHAAKSLNRSSVSHDLSLLQRLALMLHTTGVYKSYLYDAVTRKPCLSRSFFRLP